MQIGYNNDVEYRDKTFHIQTEDHGVDAASIETQIFHGGAILDTSIISYKKVLGETEDVDERIERIRALMQGNHKKLYKKLFAGEYDEMVGLDPGEKKPVAELPDDFVPSQEAVPAAALEVEKGNLDALGMEPMGESVGLAELQAQLNADAAAMEADEADDDAGAPTMMISPNEIASTQQVMAVPRPSTSMKSLAPKSNGVDFPATGSKAWRGCNPPMVDLDITELVEDFIGA
jgi:hypothetical protein